MTTVGVNSRTVVHKGSEGFSIAPVDVCKTPPDGSPVPYINQGLSLDAADEATSVFSEGNRVMIRTSCFSTSSGDEPGSMGGVISGTFMGKASFANFSYDVQIEGEPVPRAFDPMLHNHGSPANAFSPTEIQSLVALSAWEIICAAMCGCRNARPPMVCFKNAMAQMQFGIGPLGVGKIWDPYHAGIWIEVPYGGHPPSMIPSQNGSRFQTDVNGEPLPVPAPEWPAPRGSSRPDVVVTIDPKRPPNPGNISKVYELKFPGDRVKKDRNQLERYRAATGVAPKVVTLDDCGCGKKKEGEKVPQTAPDPKTAPEPQTTPKFVPTQPLPAEPKKEPKEKPPPLPVGPHPDWTPTEIAILSTIAAILFLWLAPKWLPA